MILGKTNLSEWANFRSTHSSSGWSGRGGQTRNPYALDRNPCGSSSGSGAAIAANLGAGRRRHRDRRLDRLSVGGLRAGRHQADAGAGQPAGHHPDRAQPGHGRADGAHRRRRRDPARRHGRRRSARPGHARGPAHAAGRLHAGSSMPNGLRGARHRRRARRVLRLQRRPSTGCSRTPIDAHEGSRRGDRRSRPTSRTLGKYDASELEVLLYEFKADLNAYLAGARAGVAGAHAWPTSSRSTRRNREREMPFFGQELFLQAQEKGPLTDKAYRDALREEPAALARTEGIDAVMDKHRLDALVAPTGSPAVADRPRERRSLHRAAARRRRRSPGYPSITVPAGYAFGLPVGISFIGRAWSEAELMQARLRLRAGDEAPETAAVSGDRRARPAVSSSESRDPGSCHYHPVLKDLCRVNPTSTTWLASSTRRSATTSVRSASYGKAASGRIGCGSIFPQYAGLGSSATSRRYAITSLAEADAYLRHPLLGPRLQACAAAVLAIEGRSAHEIFGTPDDLKLRSCATLFASVSLPGSVFDQLLDRYFGGERDSTTVRLLNA